MKDNETKRAFITARAEGKSYSTIQKELGISKATCNSWERLFTGEIKALRGAQMEELYISYGMAKEARIKALGGILRRLDEAIEKKNFEDLTPEKLLDLRIRYARELKEEYQEPEGAGTDNTLDGILEEYNSLFSEAKAGNVSPADVKAQLAILEAKKEALYKLALEHSKEETDPLEIDYSKQYISKLTRHDDAPEA